MIALEAPADFDDWRDQAKRLWHAKTPPEAVGWGEASLFGNTITAPDVAPAEMRVPPIFASLAQTVFMHSDPARLDLLYRLLWRLQSNRPLLEDATDADVAKAGLMAKAVRRDIHKMRAFVRFKEMAEEGAEPHYVAWFEPDHDIVRANAGFFLRRFAAMRWSILTPLLCLHWDGKMLHESPGIAKPSLLQDDPVEDLWRSYYASIFNPARLKTKAMLKEMPRRYWKNMPETDLIPGLVAGAQAREAAMIAMGAAPDEPPPADWDSVDDLINKCTRCPLYREATQAVHGEGPHDARLMIVGEQPGDVEDISGKPFVGPAGKILDEGLAAAGIARERAWVTNAVKHFKHERRGKMRLHQSPTAGEIDRCRWWLDTERKLVQPQLILALGASAIRGVLGKTGRVASYRGRPIELSDGATMVATVHPSYILRVGDAGREKAMTEFVSDLRLVAKLLV